MEFNESIYSKISQITGLNFKAQIKGCGIELQKIYVIRDLETDIEKYLLIADNELIYFKNTSDFIEQFSIFIKASIASLENEFETIQNFNGHKNPNSDFENYDRIGHNKYKQSKLLDKINTFRK
ncbi:hypothetical protein [Algibacter pectinivorans]|uniref:hypothetical protein n=1 Tax=Algibacter pectinivorans TaxID=870482 RepID=UPI0011133474|nr:hypothetical protein [Algibacter pectinivorans]